jgi:hypothetical protein
MQEKKTANFAFRLTPKRKLAIMNRSLELGKQPGEYLNDLIEKDLGSKANQLPAEQESFLEKQFQQFTEKMLSFFVDNYDKKLMKIERLSAMSYLTGFESLIQSAQSAAREKEVLFATWKDKTMVESFDSKILERVNAIISRIKSKYDEGKY